MIVFLHDLVGTKSCKLMQMLYRERLTMYSSNTSVAHKNLIYPAPCKFLIQKTMHPFTLIKPKKGYLFSVRIKCKYFIFTYFNTLQVSLIVLAHLSVAPSYVNGFSGRLFLFQRSLLDMTLSNASLTLTTLLLLERCKII